MKQAAAAQQTEWANPGALGLAAFGLNTILLQIHNLGLIGATLPLVFGFLWGGVAQIIAGIIDGRRGDTFGMTAFISYGVFWIALGLSFVFVWTGLQPLDQAGYAWMFIMWGIFTGFMTIATLKMTFMHFFVFISLTVLFFLLAAVFFGGLNPKVAGIEGIFCGAAAAYGAAGIVINAKFGYGIVPLGTFKK